MRHGASRNSQKIKALATPPISQLMIDAVMPLQLLWRQTVESVEGYAKRVWLEIAPNRMLSERCSRFVQLAEV
jgi:hypothetical protein